MNIVVIGFGYWGEKLINALLSQKEVRRLYVIDVDKDRRSKARKYKLDFFTDLNQIWDKINACVIATYEHTHYQLVKQCLVRKKHVLVEKPLTLKHKQAKELVALAQINKVTLMVDSTFLFDESFLSIEQKVKNNDIGKLKRIDSFRFSPGIVKPEANVIIDLLPHDLAIFHSLINKKLTEITVSCSKFINRSCDNAYVKLKFADVTTNSFLSWTNPVKKREMIFYGSNGVFLWKKEDGDTDQVMTFKYTKIKKILKRSRIKITAKTGTLAKVIKEFVASINTNKEPKTSGSSVLREVKILEEVLGNCSH